MKLHNRPQIVLFFAILLAVSNPGYAHNLNEKALHDEAIRLINIGTTNQIFEHFLKQRATPLSPDRRAFYKRELFTRQDLAGTRLFDSDTPEARDLLDIIKPVLVRYYWQDAIDVVVMDQKAPFIGMYRESIFVVTTSVIKMLNPDQIRACFAHELAHACFIDELIAADRAQDIAAHHLVEYKCDLIAALALNTLGQDPLTLVDGVARIEHYYKKNAGIQPDVSGHPDSPERKKCLQQFLSILRVPDTQNKSATNAENQPPAARRYKAAQLKP